MIGEFTLNKTYTDYYRYTGSLVDSKGKWIVPIWIIKAYQNTVIKHNYDNDTLTLISLKDLCIKEIHVDDYFILTDGNIDVITEEEFKHEYKLLDGEFTYDDYIEVLNCLDYMCNSYVDTFPDIAFKYKSVGYKFYISYPEFKKQYDKEEYHE